jgi:hypothetical protein
MSTAFLEYTAGTNGFLVTPVTAIGSTVMAGLVSGATVTSATIFGPANTTTGGAQKAVAYFTFGTSIATSQTGGGIGMLVAAVHRRGDDI